LRGASDRGDSWRGSGRASRVSRGSERGSDRGSGRGSDRGSGRVSGGAADAGCSLRGSGLLRGVFSIPCWPRVRFSTPSGIVGRTKRPGRSSDRGWSDPFGVSGRPSLFLRAGGSVRLTAPVGSVSLAGVAVFVCDGGLGSFPRGSRPRKTRERLRSSSSGAPGARSPAPVRRSGMPSTGNWRPVRPGTVSRSPSREGLLPSKLPRRGRSTRSGSRASTRRAIDSSTASPRRFGLPKSERGTRVTPRHDLYSEGPRSFGRPVCPPPPYPGCR